MERITRDIREGKSATIGGGGSSLTIVTADRAGDRQLLRRHMHRSTFRLLAGRRHWTVRSGLIGNLNASTVVFQSVTLTGGARTRASA